MAEDAEPRAKGEKVCKKGVRFGYRYARRVYHLPQHFQRDRMWLFDGLDDRSSPLMRHCTALYSTPMAISRIVAL